MTLARADRSRGFTLLESLLAATVLAIAVVGISLTLTATYQNTAAASDGAKGLSLARQLLEEITAKPLALPAGATPAPAPTGGRPARAGFDTIDDYHGYTDNSGAIRSLDGDTFNVDAANLVRTVTVQYLQSPTGPAIAGPSDFAIVSVSVKTPKGKEVCKLSQLVTRYTGEW